jgi:hypothetical protein
VVLDMRDKKSYFILGGIREICTKPQYITLIHNSHKLDDVIERNLLKVAMVLKCLKFIFDRLITGFCVVSELHRCLTNLHEN